MDTEGKLHRANKDNQRVLLREHLRNKPSTARYVAIPNSPNTTNKHNNTNNHRNKTTTSNNTTKHNTTQNTTTTTPPRNSLWRCARSRLGEIIIPGGTYIAQPITINEITRISSITVFTSYDTSLATAELIISTTPTPNQENTIYTYTFETPWWCAPHSWATPITANPDITLKPGTYYIILTFPIQGQTICEQIPNTPKALLINATTGQVIK